MEAGRGLGLWLNLIYRKKKGGGGETKKKKRWKLMEAVAVT